jgi:hypothetical protein
MSAQTPTIDVRNYWHMNIYCSNAALSTYDHRIWKTVLPVRSAVLKPIILHGQYPMRPQSPSPALG